jgi:predicted nucleic acid-binding protein
MTIHYLDPSALDQTPFAERGSDPMRFLFRGPLRAACSRLGLVEMIATASRKGHYEHLNPAAIDRLMRNIHADFALFKIVDISDPTIEIAIDTATRHRLRAMDALHLASALVLRQTADVTMVSADLELLSAALHEGLGVFNPAPPV